MRFFFSLTEPSEFTPVGEPALDVLGEDLFVGGGLFGGGGEGFVEGTALLDVGEDGESVGVEPLVVDELVVTMDGEEDLLGLERFEVAFALRARTCDGVAGHACFFLRAMDGDDEVIDGVIECEQTHVGLQLEARVFSERTDGCE